MATIPSLALIPSGYKASKVYSVLPTDGTGDFTFTRSGNATRVNSEGLIELVSTNVPRLNYPLIDGVVSGCPHHILEPARTNLITYSEAFDNAYWTKTSATITSNNAVSPDGTLNADLFNINNPIGEDIVSKTFSFTNGVKTNISIFIKDNDFGNQLILAISSNLVTINYDFSTQTILSTSGAWLNSVNITKVFNGFNRIDFTINPTFNSFADFQIKTNNQGNGSFYIWGAQLELGSYPTSYIPNFGTALGVTRSAETCNNAGNVNTFNDSEGVLYAEINALKYPVDVNNWLSITDGTNANSVAIEFETTGTAIARIEVGGVGQAYLTTQVDYSNLIKVAFKYKENDFAWWVNGVEVGTDSSGITFPSNTLNSLQFAYGSGGNNWAGNVKQVQYFDSALNDSDLETLTSWTSFSEMATSQLYSVE
jgi:hypothetical protein